MWIEPVRLENRFDADLLGGNEFFDLMRWKQSAILGAVGLNKARWGPYRVILRTPKSSFVVAGGEMYSYADFIG